MYIMCYFVSCNLYLELEMYGLCYTIVFTYIDYTHATMYIYKPN